MRKFIIAALLFAATTTNVLAGGILTNTNQSIAFLRNPAREGAIGIDGVYSNPAGVAFLNDGFHIGVNWQAVWQTREIETTNPMFALGAKNGMATSKTFKGEANAPFIPSINAVYNKNKWSFQFNFAVHGGGGKCDFSNGLGSFEGVIAEKAAMFGQLNNFQKLSDFGVPGVAGIPSAVGYDMNSSLQGKQYYFGFTLGAAYKINKHLSVYGGLRVLYGTASYKAKISDIQVVTPTGNLALEKYVGDVGHSMGDAGMYLSEPTNLARTVGAMTNYYISKGMDPNVAQQTALGTMNKFAQAGETLTQTGAALEPYLRDGVNLQSEQSGVGIAPIIGIDYKIGNFNFGAKYEFRTKMSLKNESTVTEASVIEAINKFRDGSTIREDNPAMLAVGGQWSALPNLRINAAYHHFFDKDSKKYADAQKNLDGDTNEYLGGIEWDPIKKLTVSGGFQITRYGLSDKYMDDMSFVVNSWSFGVGAAYQVAKKVKVEVAYFQTNYDHYKTAPTEAGVTNDFYRTNRVVGAGVTFDF